MIFVYNNTAMINKNKLRIIFLDFDGVITWPDSHWNVDPERLKRLESIIEATGAKIVISSSWRGVCKNGEEFVQKILGPRHRIAETVTEDSLFIKSIYDVTGIGSCRGDEIKQWLDDHQDQVESYVILDDDSDMLEEQLFNFVQTDGFYGISDRTVHLATQILKGERIFNPIRLNTTLIFKYRMNRLGYKNNIDELLQNYTNKFAE